VSVAERILCLLPDENDDTGDLRAEKQRGVAMKIMQFGMPTLIEIETLESCAVLCRELGLSFIEINMNLPQFQANKLNVQQLMEIAQKYNIYYTIHLDENLNPCDFNGKVATAYNETVLETIEIAKHLSVSILNMHLSAGVYFTLPNKKVFLFDEYETEYLKKLVAFRDISTRAIGDSSLRICIENCGGYVPFQVKSLDLLLKSPVFMLTFDIGHNASAGFADEPLILERADKLCHMHIHDVVPNKKDHITLGKGELDLMKYLNLAKERDCRAVIEVKTVAGLRDSVEWLRGNINGIKNQRI